MRLHMKRTTLCLVTLAGLTGLLVIQSISSYQRLEFEAINTQVEQIQRGIDPQLIKILFPTKNDGLSHEESLKQPVGSLKFHPKQLNWKSRISASDNAELKFTGHMKIPPNSKLLSLLSFVSNDSKFVENYCTSQLTLESFLYSRYGTKMPKKDVWDKFYAQIGGCSLYSENSRVVESLLEAMATVPIRHVENLDSGTQVKFVVTFENGKKALFKPMRFSRSFETHPDQFYFTDFERHNAEVAAFHLDRLLGFRRAIPTVGRVVNMTSEFMHKADRNLAKTFFYSPAKNLCFVGKCDYYCDTTHAICGKPDLVEGSFQVFLPDEDEVPRDHIRSPYKRTYSKRSQMALWQKDQNYCNWKVKYSPPYANGRALLDLIDLYIFDFLMGNQDRHHYETFILFDEPVYFLHLDNGRAFGKIKYDDVEILAPLSQCCVIRPSTFKTLLKFYAGPLSLGQALKKSLTLDPVNPVLADGHFFAIDRRLEIVLRVIYFCIHEKANGRSSEVLVNFFHNSDAPAAIDEDEEEDD